MCTGSFPGIKSDRGVTLKPSPLSSAVVKSYNSTPPIDLTACTEPQYLYNGALYLYLYLYSPYGPYGLYRASVPVQRYTLPLPIPLLPLWTVRSVQSLSACTTVHFTFTYTSTPPMGRTVCTEPQCLYNAALYLYLYLYPLWAVRPVQSLSACTTVHFTLPLGTKCIFLS